MREQRQRPGLSAPRHRFEQEDVLLRQRHDHRLILLSPSVQLNLQQIKRIDRLPPQEDQRRSDIIIRGDIYQTLLLSCNEWKVGGEQQRH